MVRSPFLHQTYELYFYDAEGARRFEALTCLEPQLVATVQRRLAEAGARFVDVHQFGAKLFTLNT